MTTLSERQIRAAGWLAYLVALPIAVIPCVDVASNVWPLRLSVATWRFGAIGLIGQGLINFTIGVMLLYLGSVLLEQRRFRGVLGVLAGVVALGLLGLSVEFGLDALQLRRGVRPELQTGFRFNVIRTFALCLYFAFVYGVLSYAGLRGLHLGRSRRAADPAALVRVSKQD